jgi:hypothetical protein
MIFDKTRKVEKTIMPRSATLEPERNDRNYCLTVHCFTAEYMAWQPVVDR